MGALVIALLFNPMSYQILKDYIELVFTWTAIVAGMWCAGFLLYNTFKVGKVTVPKKSKKSVVKSSEYIDS